MNRVGQRREVIGLSEPVGWDRRLSSSILGLVTAAIVVLCSRAFDPSDPQQEADRIAFWILAGVLLVTAACSPVHSGKRLDRGRLEVTETLYYGHLVLRRRMAAGSFGSGVSRPPRQASRPRRIASPGGCAIGPACLRAPGQPLEDAAAATGSVPASLPKAACRASTCKVGARKLF